MIADQLILNNKAHKSNYSTDNKSEKTKNSKKAKKGFLFLIKVSFSTRKKTNSTKIIATKRPPQEERVRVHSKAVKYTPIKKKCANFRSNVFEPRNKLSEIGNRSTK